MYDPLRLIKGIADAQLRFPRSFFHSFILSLVHVFSQSVLSVTLQKLTFPLASRLAASAAKAVPAGARSGPEHAYFNAWNILRWGCGCAFLFNFRSFMVHVCVCLCVGCEFLSDHMFYFLVVLVCR